LYFPPGATVFSALTVNWVYVILAPVTNLQLYIAIGLPVVAVLASMVVSLFQISGIREDIREIRSDMKIITGKVCELMAQRP